MQDDSIDNIAHYKWLRKALGEAAFSYAEFSEKFCRELLTEEQLFDLLGAALHEGRVDATQFLIANGANLNDRQWNLRQIVEHHSDKLDTFIRMGFQVDFSDTLLTYSACNTNIPELITRFSVTSQQQNIVLRVAIHNKNMPLFMLILETKPEIEDRTLIWAIDTLSFEMFQSLIDAGASIHVKTPDNNNLLIHSAIKGSLAIFNYLVSVGFNMHEKTNSEKTIPDMIFSEIYYPLTDDHFAIVQQYPSDNIVFELSANLADITCSLTWLNFLVSIGAQHKSWQCFLGLSFQRALNINAGPAIFAWLLDQGLDLSTTPLIAELEKAGYNPTLLHCAALKNCHHVVPFLLKRGFDIHAKTKHGYAPIHYARSFAMLEALVSAGADINCVSHLGHTVIHFLLKTQTGDIPEILSLTKFNPDYVDRRGNNYFHWLMIQNWTKNTTEPLVKLIKFLKESGARLDGKNHFGTTPFDLAPNDFVRNCLIELGANRTETSTKSVASISTQRYLPTEIEFVVAVKQFKVSHHLKSVTMLNDVTNHRRRQHQLSFFSDPIIRDYLTRDRVKVQNRLPVLHKYEQHFYESAAKTKECTVPYRIELNASDKDELGILKSYQYLESFYHKGTTPDVMENLKEKLIDFANQFTDNGILLLRPNDIYDVSKELDKLSYSCVEADGYYFIVMPMTKDEHAFTYCAIFDRKSKNTIATFDCNSWQSLPGFNNYAQRVNYKREHLGKELYVVIDAAHQLQIETTDGNCGIYTYDFSIALIQAFAENAKLRQILTQYSKQELQDDVEKREELGNELRNSMKPFLPQFYERNQKGEFVKRNYDAISEHFCQFRWRLGNEGLVNEFCNLNRFGSI